MLQLDLGYNPLSKVEIFSLLNVSNISHNLLCYSLDRTSKYNPKVYLSSQNAVGYIWNYDTLAPTTNTWPESFDEKI